MQILPFTDANLALSLSNNYTPADSIQEKLHFQYLKNYLSSDDLSAKCIIVEEKYISRDFLADYTSYYSLCFESYPKFCRRLHFFDTEYSEDEIKSIILGSSEKQALFEKSYLGFIVVKPIPKTIIGYTVLKTYSGDACFNERNFWGTRDYKVHLLGLELTIHSLAFQEQDSVLAACATTAIWSMLNKAALDFHTSMKSPSEITKGADSIALDGSRLFPNKGLNVLQICQAIQHSGLVSEIKQPDCLLTEDADGNPTEQYVISNRYLKKIINAYAPIGIPVILIIHVPNGETYGLHAVTISGFKQCPPQVKERQEEISWLADNIEKLYAHDDQWGPFVKIEFSKDAYLHTPWTEISFKPTYTTNIVVPVYPKIRISYEDIEAIVIGLDAILSYFFNNQNIANLTWDIKIEFSENHKKRMRSSDLDETRKLNCLTESLPKYLWIATCYIGTHKILECTFDATNVSNGMIGKDFISYLPAELNESLRAFLRARKEDVAALFRQTAISSAYYTFILEKL